MSRGTVALLGRLVRFPRVSGDEPGDFSGPIFGLEFSPRERG